MSRGSRAASPPAAVRCALLCDSNHFTSNYQALFSRSIPSYLPSPPPSPPHPPQAKKMYQGLKKREAEKAARVAALEHKAASLKKKGGR